ncbi:MAG: energy-coupling factor transporter transmembrane component T family protein [Bilifractor sp.]|jgi:energy-coupling factor transport system permease protein
MFKDITIGQYYPADSLIHKLDPRVKFVGTLIYIISLFVFHTWGYVLGTVFLFSVIRLSKVPLGFMLRGLKAIWILLIFTMVLNLFLTQGTVVWQFGILHITREGIGTAAKMGIRLVYLIIGCSIMTLTTTPNKLTDAMESLFRPLRKVHVPVHEIAMMMSIALRFIPILMEETDKIKKAQMARGADFESGNVIQRVKAMVPILVPLFVSAFRRANDLALAMEARCYRGGDGRTQMLPLVYQSRDMAAYAVLLAYLAAAIVLRAVLHW